MGHPLVPDLRSHCLWRCINWHFCTENPPSHRVSKARQTKPAPCCSSVSPQVKGLISLGDVTGIPSLKKDRELEQPFPPLQGLPECMVDLWCQLPWCLGGKSIFPSLGLEVSKASVSHRDGAGARLKPTNGQKTI